MDNGSLKEKNVKKGPAFLVHHRILWVNLNSDTKKPGRLPRFSFFRLLLLSQCTGEWFLSHPDRITPLRLAVIHLTADVQFPFEVLSSQSLRDCFSVVHD